MILDKILGKFGYIKEEGLAEIIKERDFYAKGYGHEAKERSLCIQYCEKLKKDIGALKKEYRLLEEENRILKSRYSDEVQKRFDIIEILAKSEIVIKEPEVESEEAAIWKDAKKDPPKNMKDVAVWSETGLDIGYYTEKFGWIRKDGIVIKAKYWRELSEPDVSEAKGEENG